MVKVTWEETSLPAIDILSPAYKSNGHVFTSGCVGNRADGTYGETVEEQTELAITNLKAVLKASGSSLDRVLKVLLFVRNPEDAPKVNAVYATHFTHKPARSCVVVLFPGPQILVELECVAEYDE